jgi:hypothetical protein
VRGQGEHGNTYEVTLDKSAGLGLVLVDNDNLEMERYQTVVNGFQKLRDGQVELEWHHSCVAVVTRHCRVILV